MRIARLRCEHCGAICPWVFDYAATEHLRWKRKNAWTRARVDSAFDRLLRRFMERHLPCRLAAKAKVVV